MQSQELKMIAFQLSKDLYERLLSLCRKEERSLSGELRHIIQAYVGDSSHESEDKL